MPSPRALALALAALAATLSVEAPARADTAEEIRSAIERIADENIARLRRAIAFGPEAGASGLYARQAGELDGALSLGLGLYVFHVPTLLDLRETIVELAKARLKERVDLLIKQGTPPTEDDIMALARQIFEDVKNEVLAKNPRPARTLEKPIAGVVFEASRQFRSDAWQVRLAPSVGLGPISLGPTLVAHAGSRFTGLLGAELSLRFLPEPGPRSPVVDTFVRFEAPVARRGEVSDQISVGLRLMLDVI